MGNSLTLCARYKRLPLAIH